MLNYSLTPESGRIGTAYEFLNLLLSVLHLWHKIPRLLTYKEFRRTRQSKSYHFILHKLLICPFGSEVVLKRLSSLFPEDVLPLQDFL